MIVVPAKDKKQPRQAPIRAVPAEAECSQEGMKASSRKESIATGAKLSADELRAHVRLSCVLV